MPGRAHGDTCWGQEAHLPSGGLWSGLCTEGDQKCLMISLNYDFRLVLPSTWSAMEKAGLGVSSVGTNSSEQKVSGVT